MNFLTQIVPETMYYAAVWAKPLKSEFFSLADGGHFEYRGLTKFPHIFVRGTPANFIL